MYNHNPARAGFVVSPTHVERESVAMGGIIDQLVIIGHWKFHVQAERTSQKCRNYLIM